MACRDQGLRRGIRSAPTGAPAFAPAVPRRGRSRGRADPRSESPGSESGTTLVETLAALALLGFALLMAGSALVWAEKAEGRARKRVAALELARAVTERARAASYAAVRTGVLDVSEAPLPGGLEEAEVRLEVEEDEELGLKRLRVTVAWEDEPPGSLSLVTAVGEAGLYR